MVAGNLVLRTFYVDRDLDDAICACDEHYRFRFELFRRWLVAGMRSAGDCVENVAPSASGRPPVVRTVWIDARIDSQLRREAFHSGDAKNLIAMKYLRVGMQGAPKLKRFALVQTLASMPNVGNDDDFERSSG
ncbi:hypothetical protein PFX98_01295 [Paucibacter sediminis]|uniref:Uncharacterized protein n=1 Tax=Paucibacter sediminis TaxID=3019553 RepID=A0AA95NC15_9BURK|nr:hypothetical protein [Paucibacter sp. S2-9]WIT12267.1 hypothetical protein PFX98_01295 [Paucibacter sp. S2-9]